MTLKQVLIPLSDKSGWSDALTSVPVHQYTHAHWYNHAMQIASGRSIYLYAGVSADFSVICPISPRRKSEHDPLEITTPYGFSGFAVNGKMSGFPAVWRQFMRENGFVCGHIALHPFQQDAFLYEARELDRGKNTYFIDLGKSADTIYQGCSSDHRHRLRQWQKGGFTVDCNKSPEVIAAFTNMYKQSLAARGAAKIYDFGDAAWNAIIAAPETYLFSVKVNGIVEAAAIFIAYQDIVDYYMMASTDAGRIHARGVIMAAIKFFQEKNCKWMHLGCGIRENDALEQFKARFGGSAHATYALKQVYDEQAYHSVCEKYQVDPGLREGYFPRYWLAAIS